MAAAMPYRFPSRLQPMPYRCCNGRSLSFPAIRSGALACLQTPVASRFAECLQPRVPAIILPSMSLKNAALLALVGTLLLTCLLVFGFITDVLNVARGLIPATKVLSSLVHSFAAVTVTVFFFVFHRVQS